MITASPAALPFGALLFDLGSAGRMPQRPSGYELSYPSADDWIIEGAGQSTMAQP